MTSSETDRFDQQLEKGSALQGFAAASQRIGRKQLQKLRPRDERGRYRAIAAVEQSGKGWYTLVYGMTLVLYSLPLRQGLLGYASKTTMGFMPPALGAWLEK